MAELGRREEVVDPLALNPREKGADRSLPTYGVRNPGQSAGNAATKMAQQSLNVLDGIRAAAGRVFDTVAEESRVQGKLAHMQGRSLESLGDDKFQKQGWQSMNTVSQAQDWFVNEMEFLNNGGGDQMDPDAYRQHVQESRKKVLANMPKDDPYAAKLFAGAFEDYGPRLIGAHVEKNNEYNTNRGIAELTNTLITGAPTNSDASVGTPLRGVRMTQAPVRPAVKFNDYDTDIAVRTMLGEAGGEGPEGMLAVAQVMVNRVQSGKFPNNISSVALQDKQFSTWNSTDKGGNNPWKYDKNSKAYKDALEIFKATAMGYTVDQTGGATHFYAHGTMEAPSWWSSESSGKDTVIGGHTFASHSATSKGGSVELVGPAEGEGKEPGAVTGLVFNHSNQEEGLQASFKDALLNTSSALGKRLKITSGHRDAAYNASVGGAKNSEHVHGNAADIDMSGMDDQERADLVQQLRANGMKRFITYKNSPNMLHVDMSEANGPQWFMFDKSNANMPNAPKWFQDVAAAPPPQPGQAPQVKPTGSQTQRWLQSSPLKGPAKAAALTQAILRTLDSGDDTLLNDSGGVSTLLGLGATQEQITKVHQAKQRFDEKKDKEFDLDYEKARADLMARVSNGEFETVEDALNAVDAFHKERGKSGEQTRQLARQVAGDWEKSRSDIVPVKLRRFGADLVEGIKSGLITPDDAGEKIIKFAKEAKIKDSVVNNFVADMFSTEEKVKDQARTEARTNQKKAEEEKNVVNRVTHALVTGAGLKGIGGQVRVPDDSPGNEGKLKTLTGEEYGIWSIKKSTQDDLNKKIQEQTVNQDGTFNKDKFETAKAKAQTEFYNVVYENLAKQGVYDKEFGRQVSASVMGPLVDPETKQVSMEAQQALSFYMQMKDNPSVGGAYLAGMIEDPEARNLLETASHLYNGQYRVDQALLAASTILQNKLDPVQELQKTTQYHAAVGTEIKGALNRLTTSGFMDYIVPNFLPEDIAAIERRDTAMSNYVYDQAKTYHLKNRNEPMQVSVKKAVQDLERNSVVVGKNLIIGNEQNGTRLDQVMGLTSLGKLGPHEAIEAWLDTFAGRPSTDGGWGEEWSKRSGWQWLHLQANGARPLGAVAKPDYEVSYNPRNGTLEIALYKDRSRTETIGEPQVVNASEIGAWYKKHAAVGESTTFSKNWREHVVDPAADVQQRQKMVQDAQDAGNRMGNMFVPKQ